jgi:hypothetical protein
MGDGQDWIFPNPPEPGVDCAYDALFRCYLDPEDMDDERRIELALAIHLFSRNYEPGPDEYQAIFSFGQDERARTAAQSAIAALIHEDPKRPRVHLSHATAKNPIPAPTIRTIQALCASCALRVRSTVAPWLQ